MLVVAVGNDVRGDVDPFREQFGTGPHCNGEVGVDEHTAVITNVVMRAELVGEDVAMHELEELVEVDRILEESTKKGRNEKRVPIFKTRFVGYDPDDTEWLTRAQLRNAPEKMAAWKAEMKARP